MAMDELQIGRDSDARVHFAKALEMAPDDPSVHYGLGQLEFRARHFDRAVPHFEKSGGLYMGNAATTRGESLRRGSVKCYVAFWLLL